MSVLYAIDASSANKSERTGVEWYAYHLIQELKKLALEREERVRLYSPTPLQGPLAELPEGWESRVLPGNFPGWMPLRMSAELLQRPPHVFFVPAQVLPILAPHRAGHRTLTTIHDVGHRRRPDLYDSFTRWRLVRANREAFHLATKVFVVSEFTKREVMELYHIPEDRLVVTPLAADGAVFHPMTPAEVDPVLERHRLGRHFFLHVGRWEKKKNIATLIRAFELFKATRGVGDPFELVLVGKPGGFGHEEIERALRNSSAHTAIRPLPYLSGPEIAAIMNAATAFVFPSFYEGFGIPNLEALACGTPLITSDIPPHREVVGDAAVFASPDAPEEWETAMRELAENPARRVELRERGLARAGMFSWKKTAEETLTVMRSLR